MANRPLKAELVRLAHNNPKLRLQLLPLITASKNTNFSKEVVQVRKDLQSKKLSTFETLIKKVETALRSNNITVVGKKIRIEDPKNYVWVSLDVTPPEEIKDSLDFQFLIEDILGPGWEASLRGPQRGFLLFTLIR